MGFIKRRRNAQSSAFAISYFRGHAETLREADPEMYRRVLATAETETAHHLIRVDPDAFVATVMGHLVENGLNLYDFMEKAYPEAEPLDYERIL